MPSAAAPGLWPRPRHVAARAGVLEVGPLTASGPWSALVEAAGGPRPAAASTEVGTRRAAGLGREEYRLAIEAHGVTLEAATADGARHAVATLRQLLRLHAGRVPCQMIEDGPDLAARGVLLDVSRTRVPTLAELERLVVEFAALKLNQLQLYTEHTFAYAGHEEVWRDASPLTPEELRRLDAHCRAHGIELVPNQQSFGHLHRWLVHGRYRDLAEVPEGVEHAFSIHKEPFALCPLDPRALDFLEGLYDQLLPCFSSGQFNVGLDETFDLGLGRSRAACEERGKHRVYLEFLRAVHARVAARGKRMQFWGDIILEQPELVRELPRDALALEWGYERGHPFDEHARAFAASGLEFYVCPGTSSWQSVGGRVDNMLANTRDAARAASAHGAAGCLVTDWGDRGHLQPWPVSWPGILCAAGFAWRTASAAEPLAPPELAALLDAHVFREPGLAAPLLELGRAGEASGARSTNGSPLFFLLAFAPQGLPHPRLVDLTPEGLERAEAHLAGVSRALGALAPLGPEVALARRELSWAADLLTTAARYGRARLSAADGTSFALVPRALRDGLRERLDAQLAEHRELWLARCRPGGRDESCGWLERARAALQAPRDA